MPLNFSKIIAAIPFGNNAGRPANPQPGQPYFNGETNRLEIYTQTVGWQNIVQETPSVVNIVGALNENASSTLTVNGSNFASGCIAYAIGTNGVETVATSTTLVSVVQLNAVFPALSPAHEPYDIKVVNPSNLYGILYDSVTVDNIPAWTTASGSLGTYIELSPMSVSVAAVDPSDALSSPLIYSISSGSLPSGLSINASTGVISGTPSDVIPNTTYSFTAAAYDGRNPAVTRNFSITITDRGPSWTTSTALPTFTRNSAYSTTVVATDDNGIFSYTLFSGSLPTGLTLNSSTGVISGTPTSSTAATFTVRATDNGGNYADRQFTMSNVGPSWVTSGTLSTMENGTAYSVQLSATDDSGVAPSYSLISGSLPSGITLSSSGLISGTTNSITSSTGNISLTVRATDANGTSADQNLTLPTQLYAFSSFTFTNAGVTGANGPSLAQIQSAYSATSWTQNTNNLNMTTNGYQEWTVPSTGTYRISCYGAKGGAHTSSYGSGGSGAYVRGDFSLTAGSKLKILVGQSGIDNSSFPSAGGGTFVTTSSNSPLIVAGGGGSPGNCGGGVTSTMNGKSSTGNGNGGSGSSDGSWCGCNGAGSGGGGFNTNGAYDGGRAFVNGGTGATTQRPGQCVASLPNGGFGGGGNGGNGGAGGGGYQGGNGNNTSLGSSGAGPATGEGGYSYNSGTNTIGTDGANNGVGYVVIQKL